MLLAAQPAHGYELKIELERHFGGLLPVLNDGQVYTTLARLERDELVESHDAAGDTRGKRVYALTASGRREALQWLRAPAPEAKLKDEFFLKLALSASTGMGDAMALIDAQRHATLQSLRDLDSRPRNGDGNRDGDDTVPALLREGVALHLQARLRWLDICEERLENRTEDNDASRT